MKTCFTSLLCLLLLAGCKKEDTSIRDHLERTEQKVAELAQRLESLQREQGYLTHLVFLDLKDDLASEKIDTFIQKVNQLGSLASVHRLNVGRFQNVRDPRAMSQYDIMLELTFKTTDALASYQQDEQHLAIRSELKKYLADPPVTYDYLTQGE